MIRLEVEISENSTTGGVLGIPAQRLGTKASETEIKLADVISKVLFLFIENRLVSELRSNGIAAGCASTAKEALANLRKIDRWLC